MHGFHLTGIIPVAGQPLDFEMPWHDSLMPISQNYLAVERAVVECAYAGCETIWVVCNFDMQPLIRHRLGDYVSDPVWAHRSFDQFASTKKKLIPIYYVPVHPRDQKKRDCLAWSVIYGAWMARKVSGGLSQHLEPDMYYVSFPYGVYDPSLLREHRGLISKKEPFYLSNNNKTVVDGEYLGFTICEESLKQLNLEVKIKSTGLYEDEERTKKLSLEERFSYRFFTIGEVFDTLSLEESNIINIDNYWNIDSWEGYTEYIASGSKAISRPHKNIMSYKEWDGIGVDEEF